MLTLPFHELIKLFGEFYDQYGYLVVFLVRLALLWTAHEARTPPGSAQSQGRDSTMTLD